jgi:DNA-binding transcriptional LysR family regulator
MNREDWGSLAAFAVVAEERSFTRAAARLDVSASALSHTMRRLEERLRIQLLARSTRSVSTTEAGERLLARLRPAIDEISGAVEDLGRLLGRPSGHVRITASRTAARMVIAPALRRFIASYPEIVVEVFIEPGLTDIVARRFDAGIRLGESLEKDVVAVPVTGPLRMAVVGVPQYFASHAKPSTPQDLRQHRCINFRLPSGRHDLQVGIRAWPPQGRGGSRRAAHFRRREYGPRCRAGRSGPCLPDRGPGCLLTSGWRAIEGARGLVSAVSRILPLLPRSTPGIARTRGAHRRNPGAGQGQKGPLIGVPECSLWVGLRRPFQEFDSGHSR